MSNQPLTIAFDMLGTVFTFDRIRELLCNHHLYEGPVAPLDKTAFQVWFYSALRDAMSLSIIGTYQPLAVILEQSLPRLFSMMGVKPKPDTVQKIMNAMTDLQARKGVKEFCVNMKRNTTCKIIALTNGSKKNTEELLSKNGLSEFFDEILSTDNVQKIKPSPEVYQMVSHKGGLSNTWLVSVHAWDCIGAMSQGMSCVWLSLEEKEIPPYFGHVSNAQIKANDLDSACNFLLQHLNQQPKSE